ncbi:MAG: glutamate synthase-related protein [Chloroflexi bacterium]|nr:glutamate synthase-related protein [Chloroflexota bacterium]
MSGKFHLSPAPAPGRRQIVPKTLMQERDGCLGCLVCAKRDCPYDVHKNRTFVAAELVDTRDTACKTCFRCVQDCKKGILYKAPNPAYQRLGDAYWTPEIISSLWTQSTTGAIPVSGAGYPGPFSGPGFDEMWTDMSEIVRPTRDGIHGREYISTAVDLGRRLSHLEFAPDGSLAVQPPAQLEIPLPVLFDTVPLPYLGSRVLQAAVDAARQVGILAILPAALAGEFAGREVVPYFAGEEALARTRTGVQPRMVEIGGGPLVADALANVRRRFPEAIVAVRLPLDGAAAERTMAAVEAGADVVHLCAGLDGQAGDAFMKDALRAVHDRLVAEGRRDEVTLLAGGGVGLAEHMAKAIICGADAITIDAPLLIALGCRWCDLCFQGKDCPVELEKIDPEWGARRIRNLMISWHSQLIEVLGAMGMREVRRLRGEVGRAMFARDLEEAAFAHLSDMVSGPQGSFVILSEVEDPDAEGVGAKDLAGQDVRDSSFSRSPSGRGIQRAPLAQNDTQTTSTKELTHPSGNGRPDPEVKVTPSRFRRTIGKHLIVRDSSTCIACGKCAELCPYGVHRKAGSGRMLEPLSHKCIGTPCAEREYYCIANCEQHALTMVDNPSFLAMGERRWTADLLASTWYEAERGRVPEGDLEYRTGDSGGGFDRLRLRFPQSGGLPPSEKIDLTVELNRRHDGRREIRLGMPMYGGGMSFGSVSLTTMLARARAHGAWRSFTCTGEGGYPDALAKYAEHVITQVATGLFGVREETIRRAPIVEFKYAQGAKPGLGGHLLGDKVTAEVARMRDAVAGSALFSPFPFHSVYSVEDHKKHVDWIKAMNPEALVAVKVSTPTDVDMVAVGSYYAGAHIIHLDGSYGGTGAAPDIAKKNIAMPIEYAIPKAHRFLIEEGVRDQVTLVASGGIRSPHDVAKAIALGADAVVIGTADLVALECIRCHNCESGRGCPRGIATTDPQLAAMVDLEWATQRIINMYAAWNSELASILRRLGLRSIRELVGRAGFLVHLDHEGQE